MGALVHLPTAAPSRVRQPEYHRRWRLIREGRQAGTVHRLPSAHYQSPEDRRAAAEAEERRELYAEGGIVRNAPTMLAAAVLLALDPQVQAAAIDRLDLLDRAIGGPSTRAALTYAKAMLEANAGAGART